LTNEYLKAIRFYVLTKHPVSGELIPIESYEFKMTYDDDDTVKLNGAKMSSRDDLKMQASKFVRSLVEFTGTLDALPDDRVLTMSIAVSTLLCMCYHDMLCLLILNTTLNCNTDGTNIYIHIYCTVYI